MIKNVSTFYSYWIVHQLSKNKTGLNAHLFVLIKSETLLGGYAFYGGTTSPIAPIGATGLSR